MSCSEELALACEPRESRNAGSLSSALLFPLDERFLPPSPLILDFLGLDLLFPPPDARASSSGDGIIGGAAAMTHEVALADSHERGLAERPRLTRLKEPLTVLRAARSTRASRVRKDSCMTTSARLLWRGCGFRPYS